MSPFKIATWNVNSLRVRLPHVEQWLTTHKPDVLALQEIKMPDKDFPFEAFQKLGYEAAIAGQRTYNGVALLSRHPISDVMTAMPRLQDEQKRFLCAMIRDVCVVNLYVPNGESVASEKFKYKLHWLHHLDLFLKHEFKAHHKVVVVGDFNIAPHPIDVHDPKRWEGHVLFSEPERNAFQAMLEVGFKDCFRLRHPEVKDYSWWDYRLNAFKRNWGLRIDHILASGAWADAHLTHCTIDKTPRGWERPADHAPVIAEFK
jgi:exodeoxyribonuclease-3